MGANGRQGVTGAWGASHLADLPLLPASPPPAAPHGAFGLPTSPRGTWPGCLPAGVLAPQPSLISRPHGSSPGPVPRTGLDGHSGRGDGRPPHPAARGPDPSPFLSGPAPATRCPGSPLPVQPGPARSGGLRCSHRGCSPCRCRATRLRPGSLCRPPARAAAASPPGGSSELAEPTTQPARLRLRKQGHQSSRRPSASRRPGAKPSLCLPARRGNGGRGGAAWTPHPTLCLAAIKHGDAHSAEGSPSPCLRVHQGGLLVAAPLPAPNQVPLASTEQGTAPRPCPCVPEDIPEPSMGPEGEAGSGAGTGWPLPGCRGTAHGCQEAARVTHLSTDMHIRVSGHSFLCYEICIWPRVPTTQSHPLRHQILGRALFTGGRRAAAAWI